MFKEINKDESFKCLEKAEQFMKTKQFNLAEKFVLKSKKLFQTPKADGILNTYCVIMHNYIEQIINNITHFRTLTTNSRN